jgi:hypothetical protein
VPPAWWCAFGATGCAALEVRDASPTVLGMGPMDIVPRRGAWEGPDAPAVEWGVSRVALSVEGSRRIKRGRGSWEGPRLRVAQAASPASGRRAFGLRECRAKRIAPASRSSDSR